jgi:hypothetical protein
MKLLQRVDEAERALLRGAGLPTANMYTLIRGVILRQPEPRRLVRGHPRAVAAWAWDVVKGRKHVATVPGDLAESAVRLLRGKA